MASPGVPSASWRVRPARVVLVALTLVGAGCAQSGSAQVLSRTSSNLARVRSGTMVMELVASAGEQGDKDAVGFRLEGPFALPAPGGFPTANIRYTQVAGPNRSIVQLITTGRNGYVAVGGHTYFLPPDQLERLRAPRTGKQPGQGLQELHLENWVSGARVSAGQPVEGVATDRVQGKLQVVNALNDLFSFSRQLSGGGAGAGVAKIQGDAANRLRRAVKSSRVELLTGHADRVLRRLGFEIVLASPVPPAVRQVLGPLAAPRIRFQLALTDPNKPVTVPEPANPLPASAIPR